MMEDKNIFHILREPVDGENRCLDILHSSLLNINPEKSSYFKYGFTGGPVTGHGLFEPTEAFVERQVQKRVVTRDVPLVL